MREGLRVTALSVLAMVMLAGPAWSPPAGAAAGDCFLRLGVAEVFNAHQFAFGLCPIAVGETFVAVDDGDFAGAFGNHLASHGAQPPKVTGDSSWNCFRPFHGST